MQNYSGNKTPSTQLMDLPMDMLVNILLRLPVESLRCIIRRVSKTLLNTVDSRSFARHHTLSLIAVNNCSSHVVHRVPQLMCFEKESFPTLQSLRYDGRTTLTKGRFALFTHDSNSSYQIDFVFYNLFCMASYEQCLLINPLLREVLILPTYKIQQLTVDDDDDDDDITIGLYGMGFDNRTNTYKIVQVSVRVSGNQQSSYKTHIHELGTNSWREIPSVPPIWDITWGCNICAYGDMHWLLRGSSGATQRHLVSLDFKEEKFHWTPTPPTQRSSSLHLLTLRGSMAIVETYPSPELGGGMKVEVWVMKDYAKKEWAREYSMNNVDMQPEFGLKYATCGEWEHGIFFTDRGRRWQIGQKNTTSQLFLDLRTASVNVAIYPIETEIFPHIMSYTGSLISLRDYGGIYYTDNRA